MAIMTALTTAVSGIKSSQSALDVIANNIANVNTPGYKAQTVTFSDVLSQKLSAGSAATATSGGTNAVQLGLGVKVAGTTTDLTVGSTSTTSNSLDVALTGAGYLIVTGGSEGEYQFDRAGNLGVDDDGNLNVNGYKVCGWESYTLDADGNKVYNTDGDVEAINIFNDAYSGNKKVMDPKATTSADFTGALSSSSKVATGATGMNAIGDTTDLDFDATSDITVYDSQGNDYEVSINWKKCAVENDVTSWYWEASATDITISPSSGYVAFDADGKMVTSATTLSAAVQDTAGYTSSNVSLGTGVASGDYTLDVTGTSGAYTITLTDSTGAAYTKSSTDGSATFTTSSGTITLTKPTTVSTGTSAFTVAPKTTLSAAVDDAGYASSNISAGTGVTAGNYTVTVTGTSGAYTVTLSDGTNTYSNTNGSTDGSATFATAGGTITLTKPTTVSTGTSAFAVTSTTANSTNSITGTPYTAITAGSTAATGAYSVGVVANGSTWDITLTYPSGATATVNSTTGKATFGTGTGAITLTAPTTVTAGTTTFNVAATTTLSAALDDAGYASSNISAGTGVAAGNYTVTVTGTSGAYTVVLSDGTNTYTKTSTDGSATFATAGGTITLTKPTTVSTGTSAFTVTSTTTSSADVADAGYAYSNVSIGTGVATGAYSVAVAQNADGSTWDVTLTYPDGTSKTVSASKAGAATFTTTAGTITLAAPTSIEAGTTTFTVASSTNAFDSTPTLTVTTPATAGTSAITVALDFADVKTSNITTTSASITGEADGYESGTLSSYTISSDGTITGVYSNDEKQTLAQIALAVFENAAGLEKSGNNLYTASASSGNYSTVVAGTGGSGTMTSYALELSNVDLAAQFSAMMISQRAYQANTKVVSTGDDMLQSLINMVG